MSNLCKRSEEIERAALAGLHQAASDQLKSELGLQLEEVGSATVSLASKEPENPLINRTIGLGLQDPATKAEVERIVEIYRQAGVSGCVQVAPEARPDNLSDWLTEAGLMAGPQHTVYSRGADMMSPPPSGLTVRKIGVDHAEAFANIAGDALSLSEPTRRLLEALVLRPDWRMYMSFDGDSPAGTGALFVRGNVGLLNFAATAPKFRHRGGQTFVLWKRIVDAIDVGCDLLTTYIGNTGDDSQISRRNVGRAGFQEAYGRTDWCLPSA